MPNRLREYVATVAKWYKGHISGWLLSAVAIGLCIATAYFADDPTKSARVVKWSAIITTAAAAWMFVVAQYDAWKEEREARLKAEDRLKPKAIIRNLTPRIWPAGQAGVPVTGKEYYFDIFNSSEAEALEGVRVEVAGLIPDVLGFPNAPLHVRNDSYDTREFSINPLHVRQVDLITGPVNAPNSQRVMVIPHTVKRHLAPVPNGKYEITVRVTSNNSPPVTATFVALLDNTGELQCVLQNR
jgi:hypothetical protein